MYSAMFGYDILWTAVQWNKLFHVLLCQNQQNWTLCNTFMVKCMLMHLADYFIQKDQKCIYSLHFSCEFLKDAVLCWLNYLLFFSKCNSYK